MDSSSISTVYGIGFSIHVKIEHVRTTQAQHTTTTGVDQYVFAILLSTVFYFHSSKRSGAGCYAMLVCSAHAGDADADAVGVSV